MQYSMSHVNIVEIQWNFSRMKSPEIALGAKKRFTTTEKTMGALSGAHPHLNIRETSARNLGSPKTGFMVNQYKCVLISL